jgi:hypothetical protein
LPIAQRESLGPNGAGKTTLFRQLMAVAIAPARATGVGCLRLGDRRGGPCTEAAGDIAEESMPGPEQFGQGRAGLRTGETLIVSASPAITTVGSSSAHILR